jgi:hypothetical protein
VAFHAPEGILTLQSREGEWLGEDGETNEVKATGQEIVETSVRNKLVIFAYLLVIVPATARQVLSIFIGMSSRIAEKLTGGFLVKTI